MRPGRREGTAPEWGRNRLLALVAGVAVVVLLLVAGLALAVVSALHRTGRGPATARPPTAAAAAYGSVRAEQDALAAAPMPAGDLSAAQPTPVSTRDPGVIVLPNGTATGPAGVPTGFPQTPAGARATGGAGPGLPAVRDVGRGPRGDPRLGRDRRTGRRDVVDGGGDGELPAVRPSAGPGRGRRGAGTDRGGDPELVGFLVWLPVWGLLVALVVLPVRGRPAARWLLDLVLHGGGTVLGWTRWQSSAAAGTAADHDEPELPGVLGGVRTHDGPPYGQLLTRPVVVQDLAARTWAAVARVTHPGIGLTEPAGRDRMAGGLAELMELAARTDLVDVVALQVRTVPDDGAERAGWEAAHRQPATQAAATEVNALLGELLTSVAVRTEAFVTVVVGEDRIARQAKGAGGGVDGRARVLYGVMREVEARLRGAMGCSEVMWLDSPGLAEVIRTGFAPGDRASLVAAGLESARLEGVAAGVPMGAAAATRARTEMRHYVHDAWSSVSCTIVLPDQGAVLGAVAPVLAPTAAGERRCLTVFFQPLPRVRADQLVGREEMSATTGTELRHRFGFRTRARQRRDTARVTGQDDKLARGRALVRVAAAAVTVPSTCRWRSTGGNWRGRSAGPASFRCGWTWRRADAGAVAAHRGRRAAADGGADGHRRAGRRLVLLRPDGLGDRARGSGDQPQHDRVREAGAR
jgi:hypothetical protein